MPRRQPIAIKLNTRKSLYFHKVLYIGGRVGEIYIFEPEIAIMVHEEFFSL